MINVGDAGKPLAGLKVLEIGHIVAAPYASLMLADLGADVVKVEHPEHGDHMRVAGDTARAIFASLNRDKRSIALDLATDSDREALLDLVGKVDLIVENYAPGAMEGLDLGYDRLQEANEELVYVSIKGYDSTGPYAERAATDPIVQAMSGLMSVTGHADRSPARAGTSVIDISTAQNAVVGAVLALWRCDITGEGEMITVPMYRTGVAMMGYWLAYQQQFGENPERMGASHSLYAPYDVYPTDEGYVFIGAASNNQWQAIKDQLDISLGYEARGERLAHRGKINDAITAETTDRDRDALVDTLLAAGVPAAPVNEVSDLTDDPHLKAVDALTTINTDEASDVCVPTTIPWLKAPVKSASPPELGRDTATILQSLRSE